MIVGNGLIANAFLNYKNDDNIIIFASGVSNSSDASDLDFKREVNLLKKYISIPNKKLVYFSTCSVFDESVNKTPYVLHKINIETLIATMHTNYLIFRLPIVIGKTNNPNTFFNNIKNKILNRELILVFKNASRYLIDVDDLTKFLPKIIDDQSNKIINVCFNNKLLVDQIINLMSDSMSINTSKVYIEFGSKYDVDNSIFMKDISIDDNYTNRIIKKYLQ